jgi:hypothetical protein
VSWVKSDDAMLGHPKWLQAVTAGGSAAIHLWFALMGWCSRHLTDGEIPPGAFSEIPHKPRGVKVLAKARRALVDASLMRCRSDGGLTMVDYLQYQPSRADVLAERDRWAQNKRKQRLGGNVPEDMSTLVPGDSRERPRGPVPSRPVPSDLTPSPPRDAGTPAHEPDPLVRKTLRGVVFKDEWRQAALMAGVAAEHVDEFWERLCDGPIGGKRGILPDRVLGQINYEWPKWSELKRAQASERRVPAKAGDDRMREQADRIDRLRAEERAEEARR